MNCKDAALALLSGLILIVLFPNFGLNELAWISLVPLLAAVQSKEPSKGFLLGALAGAVFHLGLIYWVTVSMTVYGKLHPLLSGLVLLVLALFLGLFVGVTVWLSCVVKKYVQLDIVLTLPFFWTTMEWVKSWFLTGFPWEHLGYSQFEVLPLIQIADVAGVYGISFVLVTVNCALYALVRGMLSDKQNAVKLPVVAVLLLSVTLGYGYLRLQDIDAVAGEQLRVAVVQPNISQDVKWDPAYLEKSLDVFKRLTLESAAERPDLIVWPESATPFFYQSEEGYQERVAALLGQVDTHLVFGSPAWEMQLGSPVFYNSALLLSPAAEVIGKYDKMHLVPYGEYVPLQALFPFINKLVEGIGDFRPGREVVNLELPAGPFGTVICYEIIFPGLVRKFAEQGARFLVNITNDAWFGNTSAPYQHLSMAAMRAVESRRYLVRAANTGISAVIRPDGRIVAQTKLFTEAVLPAMIKCRSDLTIYAVYGDVFAWGCCSVSCLMLLLAWGRRKKSGSAA
ncbi:MAG: apolipoprotein N-acyltransferase [Deltaproteobacteria bacterium]|nr:apolipoprotein N-acyltransferase [Deltaproteobacteria bacterium]